MKKYIFYFMLASSLTLLAVEQEKGVKITREDCPGLQAELAALQKKRVKNEKDLKKIRNLHINIKENCEH